MALDEFKHPKQVIEWMPVLHPLISQQLMTTLYINEIKRHRDKQCFSEAVMEEMYGKDDSGITKDGKNLIMYQWQRGKTYHTISTVIAYRKPR